MLSFVKNDKSGLSGEIYIYADKEGLLELIDDINFLISNNEMSIHLSEGNELSNLDSELIPETFTNVVHVKIIKTDAIE